MPFDLGDIVLQLDELAQGLGRTLDDRGRRLGDLLDAASQVDSSLALARTGAASDRPYLAARAEAGLVGGYAPLPTPEGWQVAAVDGSHIDVDRHLPVPCFLVNLGGCVLTYGPEPGAAFFSQPYLATEAADLHIVDPANPSQEEPVSGPLLGLVRTVRELEELARVVGELPAHLPTLALVDGSLVLWGLSGQGYRPFVREALIRDWLLPALERLRDLSQRGILTLAAYVSLPRSTEVTNAIRCCLCPHDLPQCRGSCNNRRSALAPCNLANDFLDRDLFRHLLPSGWRSPVYRTDSSVPRDHYGEDQQVYFYYINGGTEIGRVEIPRWVAEDENLLALNHALVLDQCQRGQGYPVAISESHELAVLRTSDRRLFKQLVAEILERQGLTSYTSEKERSKRAPWV